MLQQSVDVTSGSLAIGPIISVFGGVFWSGAVFFNQGELHLLIKTKQSDNIKGNLRERVGFITLLLFLGLGSLLTRKSGNQVCLFM